MLGKFFISFYGEIIVIMCTKTNGYNTINTGDFRYHMRQGETVFTLLDIQCLQKKFCTNLASKFKKFLREQSKISLEIKCACQTQKVMLILESLKMLKKDHTKSLTPNTLHRELKLKILNLLHIYLSMAFFLRTL
jgi:hypothetical protein